MVAAFMPDAPDVRQILEIDLILQAFEDNFDEADDRSVEVFRIIEDQCGCVTLAPPKVTVWPEETEPPISSVAWLKSSIDPVPVIFPVTFTVLRSRLSPRAA